MTKNTWIVVLLGFGLLGLILLEGYIKPEIGYITPDLRQEQDPLTHDLSSVVGFRSRYMGNAPNLANLNGRLPLNHIPRTLQLHPEDLTAEINYQESVSGIESEMLRRSLVYNATANFALIENLELLIFNFEDRSFTITRTAVESWYEGDLTSLLSEERWNSGVQLRLSDRAYVDRFFEASFVIGP